MKQFVGLINVFVSFQRTDLAAMITLSEAGQRTAGTETMRRIHDARFGVYCMCEAKKTHLG